MVSLRRVWPQLLPVSSVVFKLPGHKLYHWSQQEVDYFSKCCVSGPKMTETENSSSRVKITFPLYKLTSSGILARVTENWLHWFLILYIFFRLLDSILCTPSLKFFFSPNHAKFLLSIFWWLRWIIMFKYQELRKIHNVYFRGWQFMWYLFIWFGILPIPPSPPPASQGNNQTDSPSTRQ